MKIIEVNNLTKRFGKFTAVDGINFDVQKGEIFGMLGANGAGKTTTIKMLCGLLKPTEGSATVGGFSIKNQTELVKRNIGYMSQKFTLYQDLTVYENIRLYGGIYGMKKKDIAQKIKEIAKELNLDKLLESPVKSLPLGWRQKIAFSIATFHNPKIVFLDEPTSGVDPVTRRIFWEHIYSVAEKGISVVLSTHYLEEAEYCKRIMIMDKGKIIAFDNPQNLKQKYEAKTLNQVFINAVSQNHRQ